MTRLAGGKPPSSVLEFLRNVQFPARKDQIVHAARQNQAPNDIVAALGQLPANDFNSPDEVIEAYPRMD